MLRCDARDAAPTTHYYCRPHAAHPLQHAFVRRYFGSRRAFSRSARLVSRLLFLLNSDAPVHACWLPPARWLAVLALYRSQLKWHGPWREPVGERGGRRSHACRESGGKLARIAFSRSPLAGFASTHTSRAAIKPPMCPPPGGTCSVGNQRSSVRQTRRVRPRPDRGGPRGLLPLPVPTLDAPIRVCRHSAAAASTTFAARAARTSDCRPRAARIPWTWCRVWECSCLASAQTIRPAAPRANCTYSFTVVVYV